MGLNNCLVRIQIPDPEIQIRIFRDSGIRRSRSRSRFRFKFKCRSRSRSGLYSKFILVRRGVQLCTPLTKQELIKLHESTFPADVSKTKKSLELGEEGGNVVAQGFCYQPFPTNNFNKGDPLLTSHPHRQSSAPFRSPSLSYRAVQPACPSLLR